MLTTIHDLFSSFGTQGGVPLICDCAVLALALVGLVAFQITTRRRVRALRNQVAGQAKLKEAAEAANGAKREFLTHMSHEMRTPLSGVISFTDLALKREVSIEQREYLDTVRSSAEWLMHVVNQILDFSRLETGRLELDYQEFVFADCVRSAVAFIHRQAAMKNLRTDVKIDPRIPERLMGDPERLRQVLLSLLDNAVKFTTSGGVILSAALESGSKDAITIRILVDDTGIGIPSEKQQFIFEPFRLGDGSSITPSGGAGLGLAMSSRLVTLMGGSIDVQSHIGAGATFRFTARFQQAPSSSELSHQSSPSGDRVGPVSAAQSSAGISPKLVKPSLPSVASTISIP